MGSLQHPTPCGIQLLGSPESHRGRGSDAATLLIVHVSSHCRHRQSVVSEMTFASVSKTVPLQEGQWVGRATV